MRTRMLSLAVVSSLLLISAAQAAQIGYDMETVITGPPDAFENVLNVDPTFDRGRMNSGATQSTGGDPVKFGSFSVNLTGSSSNVNNSFTNIDPGPQFTIMAHVYLNAVGGDQVVASQWSGGWLFEVLNGELNFQTPAGSQQSSGAGIGAGQWHHVAVTFDNGTLRFFTDGSQVGGDIDVSGTLGTDIQGKTESMIVGNFASGGGSLTGYMDDFYFDNAVLDPSDIAFYANNTIPEPGVMSLLGLGALLLLKRRNPAAA